MDDYHELFEKIPVGVTIHDVPDGDILAVNQQFCDMLGYERAELLDLGFDDIHVDEPPYTGERAAELVRKAATDGPQTFEWLDRTKDGQQLPVEVHLCQTPIGGDERILAVVRDISERKRRQSELERRNERLEQFAAILSHDLRNPLNVAQGNLELVESECDSDHLDAIKRSHERMEALIQDLLSVARQGQRSLQVEPVGLSPIVVDCWNNVATGDARLRKEVTSTIRADEQRLKQLLENLVRNAVEHGGQSVTVTVGELSDGFFFEDDGPGFPSDVIEGNDIEYPDSVCKDSFGLTIVDQIARSHGWTVDLTESGSGGARVEICGVEMV
jgi:PAS domain S-box-containing protein